MNEATLELLDELHLEVNDLISFLDGSGGGEGPAPAVRRLLDEARDLARKTEALEGPDHAVQTQAERIQRRIDRIYQEARSRIRDRATDREPDRV